MSAATLFRTRAVLNAGGVNSLITHYWADGSVVGGAALATEALARVRAFFQAIAAEIRTGCVLTQDPVVTQLSFATGKPSAVFTGTLPAAVTFSAADAFLPQATMALVRFNTGIFINGRKVVGRSFIPGLTELANATGVGPVGSTITALGNANAALGATVLSNIDQVVWHRPNKVTGAPGTAEVVTSRSVSSTWAVQRNRRS